MTGSPVFSVNFTNRKKPAKPNYYTWIKKSQAILKCFTHVFLMKRLVHAGLRKRNHVL